MENQAWIEYKSRLRERLRLFALDIIKLSEDIPNSQRGRVLNNQVTRSGTSMYANYRAALRGRSKAEFFSKLCISVEEADETEMWLELLISSGILDNEFVRRMHKECFELLKMLASMRKSTSKKDE